MTTTNDEMHWVGVARELRPMLAERAARVDADDAFVADNYELLKQAKLMSALVPSELGGGGASLGAMSAVLRELAGGCGSTALALSMHQHLVAATVWKVRRGQPGKALLDKVLDGERVLVSTGARDWTASNGTAVRDGDGYRVSGRKAFASGSPVGDFLITSAPSEAEGEVLHFAVPLAADGVRIERDWATLGMRATGSHTVVLEDVFVPAQAIAMRRPAGPYPAAFNVVLGVALPLITSVYVGVAEQAAALVTESLRGRTDAVSALLVGEMQNRLTVAQLAVADMVRIADGLDFPPELWVSTAMLTRKTLAVDAALATTEKALEATGGAGFYRRFGLERLLRDAHAGQFHPLPEKRQQLFCGRVALGLDPLGGD